MPESPLVRGVRAALADVDAEVEFRERLIDALDDDPDVRAAILRAISKPVPTKPAPRKKGGR